jgi:hypothetical protein
MIGLPWAKLAAVAFAMALGAAIATWGYARPMIARKDAQIASMVAADAKATADFQTAARKQEEEKQNAVAKVESDYLAAQHQRDSIIAGLSRDAGKLRDTISSYASRDDCRLPQAASGPSGPDDAAVVLGRLLAEGTDLLAEGAGDAGRAADQIRALQGFEGSR